MKNKTRKFKFIGYGDRLPIPAELNNDYLDMPQDKYYWYVEPILTVGKVYEAQYLDFDWANGFMPEITVIDDEGDLMTQELQFFEEVLE